MVSAVENEHFSKDQNHHPVAEEIQDRHWDHRKAVLEDLMDLTLLHVRTCLAACRMRDERECLAVPERRRPERAVHLRMKDVLE